MRMTPEEKLSALFAEQAPPARDPAFTITVMERVARRRAVLRTAAVAPWAVAAGAVIWSVQPLLEPVLATMGPALATPAAILAGTLVLVAGGQIVARHFGGFARR